MSINNRKRITKCLLCNEDGFLIKTITKYNIYKCNNCNLEYVNPMPTDDELKKFYEDYSDIRAEDSVLKKNAIRNIKFLHKFGLSKKSKLLDYGCGKNLFVKTGGSPNWFGYDKYSTPENNIINDYKLNHWDFITMWGVLEHLINPKKTLKELTSYLDDGGKIVLTTVATESKIPIQYKPPEHVTFWAKKSVEKLFSIVGMEILDYHNYEMVQYSDIYLDCVLRTVPLKYKSKIFHKLPKYVVVPTNEIFIVAELING